MFRYAVNEPFGQSIGDGAFHVHAVNILSPADSEIGARLCLESTMNSSDTHMADAMALVEERHRLDVRIALDGFGAGASSFEYLNSLAVDVMKIDGKFVRGILENALDKAAVRCL